MSDNTSFDLANKTIGYVGNHMSASTTIPTTQYWAYSSSSTTTFTRGNLVTWPGFGNKRARYSGSVQSGGTGIYGFGVVPIGNGSGGIGTNGSVRATGDSRDYFTYGSGAVYTPTFLNWYDYSGYLVSAFGFTDAYGSTVGAAQQACGFDDWHDGSGMSDIWDCENTGQGTARGKPSFIMIK
jgi:hypothetical protein